MILCHTIDAEKLGTRELRLLGTPVKYLILTSLATDSIRNEMSRLINFKLQEQMDLYLNCHNLDNVT